MILQNWWYTTLLNTKTDFCPPLTKNIRADFLIVGGGMAGLHAALYLARKKQKVVLVEKNICGGSSTGKSAGFLTPESELGLEAFFRRYGPKHAKKIWSVPEQGVELIVQTAKKYKLKCDLQKQDSLFVGLGRGGYNEVIEEINTRKKLNYPGTLKIGKELKQVNSGEGYTAAMQYGNTYSINPLLYSQELKEVLIGLGVKVYESTQVEKTVGHRAYTHLGSITAKNIIMCIDKVENTLSEVAKNAYHAQTFLSISEPLKKEDIKKMFPTTNVMCWDSRLVYTYYRLTGDNRLLLGGGSALTTFTPFYVHTPRVIESVIKDIKKQFPFLKELEFIQYWPGYIDTTKDMIPIVDFDSKHSHIQYVVGNVGLPWAAFCGMYAAKRVLEPKACHEYYEYFSSKRKFLIPDGLRKIIGKPLAFIINNSYSIYLQKDKRFIKDQ